MLQDIRTMNQGAELPALDAGRRAVRLPGISQTLQRELGEAGPEQKPGDGPPACETAADAVKDLNLGGLEEKYRALISQLEAEMRPALIVSTLSGAMIKDKLPRDVRTELLRRAHHLNRLYRKRNPPEELKRRPIPAPGSTVIGPAGRAVAILKKGDAGGVLEDDIEDIDGKEGVPVADLGPTQPATVDLMSPLFDSAGFIPADKALEEAARRAVLRVVGTDGCAESDLRPLAEGYGVKVLAKAVGGLRDRLSRGAGRISLRQR